MQYKYNNIIFSYTMELNLITERVKHLSKRNQINCTYLEYL